MLKSLYLAIFIISVSVSTAFPQVSVTGFTVYSTYKMNEIKEFQQALKQDVESSLELQFQELNHFSANLGFGLKVAKTQGKYTFGLGYERHATGGRIGYADYSGIVTIDNLLIGHMIYIYNAYSLYETVKYDVSGMFNFGGAFAKHILIQDLNLTNGFKDQMEDTFASNRFLASVGLNGNYNLSNKVFLYFSPRYEINFADAYIQVMGNQVGPKDELIRIDWSGIRLETGLGVRF